MCNSTKKYILGEFMNIFYFIGELFRKPSGAYSPPHIIFASFFVILMITMAIVIGILMRKKDYKTKNRVIVISAISILSFEAVKIIVNCINSDDIIKTLLWNLPLFLCSIQLVAIPVAAFCKGRLKEAALDFVMIFGILGALVGPIGAAQDYNSYPVLSFPNFVSATTHSISGFTSLYIIISGMASVKKKNIWITHVILGVFCTLAYLANIFTGLIYGGNIYENSRNYMFFMYHDGTPYSLVYNMVNGNKVIYPILVVVLFVAYMAIFYLTFMLIRNYLEKRKSTKELH